MHKYIQGTQMHRGYTERRLQTPLNSQVALVSKMAG